MEREEFDKLKQSNDYESFGFKNQKVKRTLFYETKYIDSLNTNIEFKYKENIVFFKENKSSRKAICIGYNPAKATKEIDVTNKRLIDCLWNEYDEYMLVNLYPQVSSNKTTCITDLEENENFCNVIIDIIKSEKDCIILFFGRTVNIKDDIYDAIVERINNKMPIKMTTHNDKFTHPGSNADIKLIDIQEENLRSSYRIE